jgi:hypothetical protein
VPKGLFVLSHVVITVVSYVVVSDVTLGWLLINISHNAQYFLFVWAYNARRFEKGIERDHPWLSRLSQPGHVFAYGAVCLGLSTALYFALGRATAAIAIGGLPLVLIAHQAVNFHHYLVDAPIWKSPK